MLEGVNLQSQCADDIQVLGTVAPTETSCLTRNAKSRQLDQSSSKNVMFIDLVPGNLDQREGDIQGQRGLPTLFCRTDNRWGMTYSLLPQSRIGGGG